MESSAEPLSIHTIILYTLVCVAVVIFVIILVIVAILFYRLKKTSVHNIKDLSV